MSAILSGVTKVPVISEAADGRFFNGVDSASEEISLGSLHSRFLPGVLPVLMSQKETATEALDTLATMYPHQTVVEAAQNMSELYSRDALDKAHSHIADIGTIWRRQTDRISLNIARALPKCHLGRLVVNSGDFFTSGRNIYENNGSGHFSIYSSMLDRGDYNFGVRPADQSQWLNFLFRLTTLTG